MLFFQKTLSLLPLLLLVTVLQGQVSQVNRGDLRLNESQSISELQDLRKMANRQKNRTVTAWSVQLLVTRDRYEVIGQEADFKRRYREMHVNWEYDNPYYRLTAGAFFRKVEAAALLHEISELYPNAYIVKNNSVKPTDFLDTRFEP